MEIAALAQDELKEYLMKNPENVRLVELQEKGWQNPAGDGFFEQRRQHFMNADEKGQTMLFNMMARIGEEINASTGAFNLSDATPNILDLCAAPGGFVKYALKINPSCKSGCFESS